LQILRGEAVKLSDNDAARLTKLLGMLNSPFEGERANAGKMADELLRARGLRWADVLNGKIPHAAVSHKSKLDEVLSRPDALSAWELKFCRSLRSWRRHLTEKQARKLDEIHERTCS
jgi:hypothetical protein